MGIEFKIEGAEALERSAASFAKARAALRTRVYELLLGFGNTALAIIKKDYMTGPRPTRLGVGTGRLRSSIRYRVNSQGDDMQVTFGTDVPYAAIHEFGGKTRPHVIRPRRKGFLAFIKNGQWVYTRGQVQHPGSTIPARPYLRPGVEDAIPKLREKLLMALEQTAQGAYGGQ